MMLADRHVHADGNCCTEHGTRRGTRSRPATARPLQGRRAPPAGTRAGPPAGHAVALPALAAVQLHGNCRRPAKLQLWLLWSSCEVQPHGGSVAKAHFPRCKWEFYYDRQAPGGGCGRARRPGRRATAGGRRHPPPPPPAASRTASAAHNWISSIRI